MTHYLSTASARRRPQRVGLYCRCSTREQTTEGQLHELRQVAAQRGWIVAAEYVDAGESGVKTKRPQLSRLMCDATRGKLDVVACVRFDRFARSVKHLVLALDEFRALGVDFVSLHDGIDTSTPAGRFTFHVIAAVAELERELIRERTRAGIEAARRRGSKIGRPRAALDLAQARVLRSKGCSFRQIARRLGASETTVRRALRADNSALSATPHSES